MANEKNGQWYMPASVLNALWGNIMPKLAASVWRGTIDWPPKNGERTMIAPGLEAVTIEGEALKQFAEQLVRLAFTSWNPNGKKRRDDPTNNYKLAARKPRRLTKGQRSALVATEYFHPGAASKYLTNRPPDKHRMKLRVIETEGYDFVLTDQGLDVFVPPVPGDKNDNKQVDQKGQYINYNEEDAAREYVLRHYKFRETSRSPITLPGAPQTSFHLDDDRFISIPQLTAPTGGHQVPEAWIKGVAPTVKWSLTGSTYRAMMSAFPRIVANVWYEEVAWDPNSYKAGAVSRTHNQRFYGGELRKLLEEQMETSLPSELEIFVSKPKAKPTHPTWVKVKKGSGWNPWDVMITSEGLYFPSPGPAPQWRDLVDAIEQGRAGNPVFTDTK